MINITFLLINLNSVRDFNVSPVYHTLSIHPGLRLILANFSVRVPRERLERIGSAVYSLKSDKTEEGSGRVGPSPEIMDSRDSSPHI